MDEQHILIGENIQPEGYLDEIEANKQFFDRRRTKKEKRHDPQQVKKQNRISHIGINVAFAVSVFILFIQLIELAVYYWYISFVLLLLLSPLYFLACTSYNRCSQAKEKLYVPLNHHAEGEPECAICHCTKPERSHHCSRCGRCVLKMDHHCPFVGSCIGYANHKYFLLTLFYTFVLCSFLLLLTISILTFVIFKMANKTSFKFEEAFLSVHSVQLIISLYFVSVTFLMILQQLYHTLQNETGIEIRQNQDHCSTFRRNKEFNPYNIGLLGNLKEMFGDSILLGLLPIWTTKGDGHHFPKNEIHNTEI